MIARFAILRPVATRGGRLWRNRWCEQPHLVSVSLKLTFAELDLAIPRELRQAPCVLRGPRDIDTFDFGDMRPVSYESWWRRGFDLIGSDVADFIEELISHGIEFRHGGDRCWWPRMMGWPGAGGDISMVALVLVFTSSASVTEPIRSPDPEGMDPDQFGEGSDPTVLA